MRDVDTCRYMSIFLTCGILSNSSDIEGCRAVVSGVIWIRLLDSARLIQV